MKMRSLSIAVAVLGALAATTLATPQESRTPSRADRDIQGLMEAYVISKMQEALQLDDDQFAKMVVAQKKRHEHRREFQRKRRESLRELQRLVRATDSQDGEIMSLIERLDSMSAEFEATRQEDYRAIDEILTVRQRGRYRLLEVMLERRLQELMQEARGRQGDRDRRP